LESEDLGTVLSQLPQERTYISGVLTLEDAEDLVLPTHPDQFDSMRSQLSAGLMIIHLQSASSQEITSQLGEYFATGTLIVRSIHVR
jgi:inner membrane protein